MRFTKVLPYFFLFLFSFSLCYSQDHLVPLTTNPVLTNLVKHNHKSHTLIWRPTQDSIVDTLPFIDDFSKRGVFPDTSKWMDNAAFINYDFPICPHTLGVATLDGINADGMPYNPSALPGSSLPADSLTSRPILLNNIPSFDTIYFSFYYQSGGRGVSPKYSDSLLVQFKTSQIPWTTVWYHTGYTPNSTDTGFHYVLIPVTDPKWWDANFQFRFKNYACTSAMVDQWNIDEVYLNKQRSITDTSQRDVSFVYEAPSLLANYQYMPWEQFTQNDLATNNFLFERSNDNYIHGISLTYSYTIPAIGSNYPGGTFNIYPFGVYTPDIPGIEYYNNYAPQTLVPIGSNFNYTALIGPTTYTITHLLSATGDFIPQNDTLRFDQIFSNYYAYDDGTAEAAYFINGGGLPSDLAYQFSLNQPDKLVGLDIYFAYMFINSGNYTFRLAIWDNSGPGGSPGVMKWENDSIMSPRYSDSLNGFTYYPYKFDKDTTFNGTFFVGWVQTYGDSLNIGYDLNTDHHDMIYYNAGGAGWSPGDFPGSMMMRPVFSSNPNFNEVNEVKNTTEQINISPNPAQDEVSLSMGMPANTILRIYGVDGRICLENDNFSGNKVNTSTLQTGVYVLELNQPGKSTCYRKLVIQR